MAKDELNSAVHPPLGFYRPHQAVNETGAHPDTGEVEPSLTKQAFKDECDINNIIREFSATGMFSHINARAQEGRYENLPSDYDLQSAIDTVRQAEAAFMSLPAKTRDRFGNDPVAFVSFLQDEANRQEAIDLGLVVAPPPPPAPPPTVTAPTPPAEPSGPKAA